MTIDDVRHHVTMAGQEVELTPTEYLLLSYLADNVEHVVTQDQLLEHVWGREYAGESYLLQAHVNRLRHKLEPDPVHPHYILTRAGIGYLLVRSPVCN